MYANFNPHSREGSDGIRYIFLLPIVDFNPHSREGSDQLEKDIEAAGITISIHTPVKGVTPTAPTSVTTGEKFQSTLP